MTYLYNNHIITMRINDIGLFVYAEVADRTGFKFSVIQGKDADNGKLLSVCKDLVDRRVGVKVAIPNNNPKSLPKFWDF